MIYEVREYTAIRGQMPALIRRFNDHALGLFRRHGLDCVLIAQTEQGDVPGDELVYVLRFASHQDMTDRWASFRADPDWIAARSESERDGPLVAAVRRRVLDAGPFLEPTQ
jgi:hypothetical protein